jgi:hypothetical protein
MLQERQAQQGKEPRIMAATSTREGPFVVIAEFDVRPDGLERFLELAREDASASVSKEPGCYQFDVTVEQAEPNRVVLYESTRTRRRSTRTCRCRISRPSATASSPW